MKYFLINTNVNTRDELLTEIANLAKTNKITTSKELLFNSFLDREKLGTTGFEDEIAIPHARIDSINENAIIIARNSKGIDWPSLDKKPTKYAIALCITTGKSTANDHMKYLAAISSQLMIDESKQVFKSGSLTKVKNLIKASLEKKQKVITDSKPTKNYDIVAISTCPTGIAHTHMAADALIKEAKKQNLTIRVERQAAEGVIDRLSKEHIKNAKIIIIAAGKQVDEMARFIGSKIYKVKIVEPIRSAKKVINDAREKSIIYKPSKKDTAQQAMSTGGGATPLQALMNGVSYMIPFVVVGGILIAMSLGIGGTPTKTGMKIPPNSFWSAINGIGVVGFTLMIPILGGFIGSAIGGRAALAPSMIISYVIGNQDGQLWNWNEMQFGGFAHSAKLGFLGAIAAGFLCGYLVKNWRRIISVRMPKMLKPVEPIIFIPLVIVSFSWVLFAFFGYLPLYYLSSGLNTGVTYLVNKKLFFIAALILGAMIAFDMGGPVNKIAFLLGGGFIAEGIPQVMGAVAAAIAVPPIGCGLGFFIGKYVFRIKIFDDEDKGNAISAIFMGSVGVTEGAIPFAIKFPKQVVIANVIGGAVGAGLAGLFQISDSAQHGGIIVYILGAIGKDGITNYLWGMLYLVAIFGGALTTALIMAGLLRIKKRPKKQKATQKA